jgi:hypothetical protein
VFPNQGGQAGADRGDDRHPAMSMNLVATPGGGHIRYRVTRPRSSAAKAGIGASMDSVLNGAGKRRLATAARAGS